MQKMLVYFILCFQVSKKAIIKKTNELFTIKMFYVILF
jgi:hypothetical protein